MTLSLDMPTQPDGDPAYQNFMLGSTEVDKVLDRFISFVYTTSTVDL